MKSSFRWLAGSLFLLGHILSAGTAWSADPDVHFSAGGTLDYEQDAHGNRVPDFSYCGYAAAERATPTVRPRVVLQPADGDNGVRIQRAIEFVSTLPPGEDGFRGAVLLGPGEFQVAGQLRIASSGVVLRGSGAGVGGTTITATGLDRRPLIRIVGDNDRTLDEDRTSHVVDDYAPVGTRELTVDAAEKLQVGDTVLVTRPSTAEWIDALGARAFGVGWRPGSRDLVWDRTVTKVEADQITLDAPITTAIEARFGGATVVPYTWPGRARHVGVEDLRLVSEYNAANPRDEDHAWFGVVMNDVEDAWVRRVRFEHFAGGAVALWENSRRITVEDCAAEAPVSELGGYRRHTFFTQGQLTLFLRCWSDEGRHDFSVGHCAAGPNAFVNCFASRALDCSGPIESWAAGVLYDNVRIDGNDLSLENRWSDPPGTGWAAANCMLWQCQAATVRAFRPPTADNWVNGFWAKWAGDAEPNGESDFVRPLSLYQAQLAERMGRDDAARAGPFLLNPEGSTSPTYAEAEAFVARSNEPARRLIELINERMEDSTRQSREDRALVGGSPNPSPADGGGESDADGANEPLRVHNGWLVVGDRLKTGRRLSPTWWRGNIRPHEAPGFGPAITRFVPGREGTGFTDELEDVARSMKDRGVAVLDHHYGLWYDRRRDDHLMVRRADGDVAPPFYEQPFARTGTGRAWDGLSKYDLTQFNPWYWNRLRKFAQLCDRDGLVLFHQNYFQHNILEAGGHWVDCPWRPANNVNDTGLPEPPPYIGDKRLFIAHKFYDVTNEPLRQLHRGYIRQCLDNFADSSNVIQLTGAEFTGPLEFVEFWIDTIAEWQQEHDREVLVGLSTTKDVQDAILADPVRSRHVDVIDIRYWHYEADGDLYAPPGGANMAPRQHARQLRPQAASFASVANAVREYRTRFPDKAVIYNADSGPRGGRTGWAVLIGGGSLPAIPQLPPELAATIPAMTPRDGVVNGGNGWCLASDDHQYLIYAEGNRDEWEVNLPTDSASYRVQWITPRTGDVTSIQTVTATAPLRLHPSTNVLWLTPDN